MIPLSVNKFFITEVRNMSKINKSRKGLTLIEMVLTMAIIVILASIVMLGVGFYLDAANVAAADVNERNESVEYVTSEVLEENLDLE